MGYVSLSEDIRNKFFEMREMIDNSASDIVPQKEIKQRRHFTQEEIDEMYEELKFTKRQLYENKSRLSKTELESKNSSKEIEKMQELINAMRDQNESLKLQLSSKEGLLVQLRNEITSILDKHEIAIKTAKNRSQETLRYTVNKVNDENAETVLQLKSGIAQIGTIVHQQNFHKQVENINTIKLIIKKLTGL